MKYRGKRILLTGATGFIGRALYTALAAEGAKVTPYGADIRSYLHLKEQITHKLDYVFHFAGPSSQILFERNMKYCYDATINPFMNIAKLCQANGVKLIYPSTGLLSQGRENQYARAKKVCEDIHLGSGVDALGLRIFAGYGRGEGHKRDYASVPYLFMRNVMDGVKPVVYGDGNQVRDFIYISDLVKAIMILAESATEPIIDVGSGEQTSFNEIIEVLQMQFGQKIPVDYIAAPANYVEETHANTTVMRKYNCEAKQSIRAGIRLMYEWERKNKDEQTIEEGLR